MDCQFVSCPTFLKPLVLPNAPLHCRSIMYEQFANIMKMGPMGQVGGPLSGM